MKQIKLNFFFFNHLYVIACDLTVNNNYIPKLTGLCNGESVKEELNSYI